MEQIQLESLTKTFTIHNNKIKYVLRDSYCPSKNISQEVEIFYEENGKLKPIIDDEELFLRLCFEVDAFKLNNMGPMERIIYNYAKNKCEKTEEDYTRLIEELKQRLEIEDIEITNDEVLRQVIFDLINLSNLLY